MTPSASPRHVVAVTALGAEVHVEVSRGHADGEESGTVDGVDYCEADGVVAVVQPRLNGPVAVGVLTRV